MKGAPFIYNWSNGATTSAIIIRDPGIYEVTVTDNNGCTIDESYTILDNRNFNVDCTLSDMGCLGKEINVQIQGGKQPYEINYTGPNAGGITELMTNQYTIENPLLGNYSITIIDSEGKEESCEIVIENGEEEDVQVTITNSCEFEGSGKIEAVVSSNASSPGPYIFSWSEVPSGSTVSEEDCSSTLANLPAGSYCVTVTSADGCRFVECDLVITESELITIVGETSNITENDLGNITTEIQGGTAPLSYNWSNGATTASIENLEAGIYIITVTDVNTCTATESFEVIDETNQPEPLMVTCDKDMETMCSPYNILVTIEGGMEPFIVTYDGPTFDRVDGYLEREYPIEDVEEGEYIVTIVDATGLSSECSISLIPERTEDITVFPFNTSCIDGNFGRIKVQVNSNASVEGPYTFKWLDKEMNEITDEFPIELSECMSTISMLPADTYYIEVGVEGEDGCFAMEEIIIEGEELEVIIDEPMRCLCEGSTIIFNTMVSGGARPYTYTWSDPILTGATPFVMMEGMYQVTVVDANGCEGISSFISIESCPGEELVVSFEGDGGCQGLEVGQLMIMASGGKPPYRYDVTGIFRGYTSIDTDDPVHINLPLDAYTVVIRDANGCSTMDQKILEPSTEINIVAEVEDEIACLNEKGSVTITVGGGEGDYTYEWKNRFTGEQFMGSNRLDNLDGGSSYSVTVTDSGGCLSEESITINEIAPLELNIIELKPQMGTSLGSIVFEIIGGIPDYTLKLNQNNNNLFLAEGIYEIEVEKGSYELILEDANSCIFTQLIEVEGCNTSGLGISVSPSIIQEICTEEPLGAIKLRFNSVDPFYVEFMGERRYLDPQIDKCITPDGDEITCTTYSGLNEGEYEFKIYNECLDLQRTIVHTIKHIDDFSVSNFSPCGSDEKGELNVRPNYNGVGEDLVYIPFTYQWSNGINQEDDYFTFQNLGSTIFPEDQGEYQVTITNEVGCSTVKTFDYIDNRPKINLANIEQYIDGNTISFGGIDIDVIGGNPPYQFYWNGVQRDGEIVESTAEDFFNLLPGIYSVVVTDNSGCSDFEEIEINSCYRPDFWEVEYQQEGIISSTIIEGVDISIGIKIDDELIDEESNALVDFDFLWEGPNGYRSREKNLEGLRIAGDYCLTVTDVCENVKEICVNISECQGQNIIHNYTTSIFFSAHDLCLNSGIFDGNRSGHIDHEISDSDISNYISPTPSATHKIFRTFGPDPNNEETIYDCRLNGSNWDCDRSGPDKYDVIDPGTRTVGVVDGSGCWRVVTYSFSIRRGPVTQYQRGRLQEFIPNYYDESQEAITGCITCRGCGINTNSHYNTFDCNPGPFWDPETGRLNYEPLEDDSPCKGGGKAFCIEGSTDEMEIPATNTAVEIVDWEDKREVNGECWFPCQCVFPVGTIYGVDEPVYVETWYKTRNCFISPPPPAEDCGEVIYLDEDGDCFYEVKCLETGENIEMDPPLPAETVFCIEREGATNICNLVEYCATDLSVPIDIVLSNYDCEILESTFDYCSQQPFDPPEEVCDNTFIDLNIKECRWEVICQETREVLEIKEQLWELCIEVIEDECTVYRYCPESILSETGIMHISDDCSITNTTVSCTAIGGLFNEKIDMPVFSIVENKNQKPPKINNNFRFNSKVFPNPVKDQINIEIQIEEKNLVQILIIDVLGNLVVTKEYKLFAKTNLITINSESLNSGLYHVILKNKNGYISSHKIVKH